MIKICLALVHNHDKKRIDYIISELRGLKELLENENFIVELIQVAYQSEITPHGRAMSFFRDVIYQLVGFKWAVYRRQKYSFMLFAANLIRLLLRGGRYSVRSSWRRSSAIEVAVTDKHIRAWSLFLDLNSDFLIVFEDDAVFNTDSKLKFCDLLKKIIQEKSERSIYVDLAGGCKLESLKIDRLLLGKDELFRYYQKPVTNTACSYLINKSLATQFYQVLTRQPWLRLIGVDWMMNALFMNLVCADLDCICMHAEPTIFKHGSTTGEYLPWTR